MRTTEARSRYNPLRVITARRNGWKMKQQQNPNLSFAVAAAAAQEQEQRRDYDADADEGLSQDGNEGGAFVTQVKAIVGSYLHCLGDLYLIDLYSDHYGRSTSTKAKEVPNTFVERRPQQEQEQEQEKEQEHHNYDSTALEKRTATFEESLSDTDAELSSTTVKSEELTLSAAIVEESSSQNKSTCPWGKILMTTVLAGIVTFVIIDFLTNKHITHGFHIFLEWIEANLVAGVFAFIGVYFIATICFVPGSLLTLGSGFVFGSVVGVGMGVALASLAVFVGDSLGSVVAFCLARYILRDCVRDRLVMKYTVVEAINEAVQKNGFKIFFLLRVSSVVPCVAINYIAGVTGISLKNYTLALVGAMLPSTVLFCFIGASAGAAGPEGGVSQPITIASLAVGIVLAFVVVLIVSYYAKKEFNKIIGQKQHTERAEAEGGESYENEEEIEEGGKFTDEEEGACHNQIFGL